MPMMAFFDRGQHAAFIPAHAHGTPLSLSKMQPTATISIQESTVFSLLSHPTHSPVQFLHGDTMLQKITPCCHCCHLPTAPIQHSSSSSTELTTVNPESQWLYMLEMTANAVLTLLQQAPAVLLSTSYFTHPLVQNLQTGDTTLPDSFKTPCLSINKSTGASNFCPRLLFLLHWRLFSLFPWRQCSPQCVLVAAWLFQPFCLAPATPRPTTHQHVKPTILAASLVCKTRSCDLLKEAFHKEILEAITALSLLHYSCPYPQTRVLP
jgi:hypothetical protein